MIAVPAVIVVALVLALTAGGGTVEERGSRPRRAGPTAAPTRRRADRFDSGARVAAPATPGRARPAPGRLAAARASSPRYLRERLPRGHYEAVPGHPGLRNVVGRIPGRKPAVVLAAHYDTKDLPGFVGANDGAGGTAAVLEIARALRKLERPTGAPEIRFVLFDGEEATDDTQPLRGRRRCAARRPTRERHAKEIRALVLLDFVAEKGAMRIPREAGSDERLWARLRAAAKRVGSAAAFPPGLVGEVTDDHTPFMRRGIPAIDLIDFTFDCWHKPCDDLSAVSERSLDLSGEAVLELLRTWR